MKEEHFGALESFWNNVIKNVFITRNHTKANSVFLLPKNFGGGLRSRGDIIWGTQVLDPEANVWWDKLEIALAKDAYDLDIVYDDPYFNLNYNYQTIYR